MSGKIKKNDERRTKKDVQVDEFKDNRHLEVIKEKRGN